MVAIKYSDGNANYIEKNTKFNNEEHGIIKNLFIIKRPNKKKWCITEYKSNKMISKSIGDEYLLLNFKFIIVENDDNNKSNMLSFKSKGKMNKLSGMSKFINRKDYGRNYLTINKIWIDSRINNKKKKSIFFIKNLIFNKYYKWNYIYNTLYR
jgi:hypothetical protein